MNETLITIFGWAAACFTTISSIPQAIKVIRSHKTGGISLLMYVFFTLGIAFWIVYGLMINNPIIWVTNTVTLVFSVITLGFKIYNVASKKEPLFNRATPEAKAK